MLVIETYPRWEYRYLRNALSRDPGVEVSCLLIASRTRKVRGWNRDYIKEFPTETDQLSTYDVVFVGDIGVGAGQLTENSANSFEASSNFKRPGWCFCQASGEPIDSRQYIARSSDPGTLRSVPTGGNGRREAMHFELTESGVEALTKLADTDDDNLNVWSTLRVSWYAPVVRARWL